MYVLLPSNVRWICKNCKNKQVTVILKFFMFLLHTFQFFIEKIFKGKFHESDFFLPLISRVFLAWSFWYFNLHKWQKQTRHTYKILHVVVPYMMMSEFKSLKFLVWCEYILYIQYVVCMFVYDRSKEFFGAEIEVTYSERHSDHWKTAMVFSTISGTIYFIYMVPFYICVCMLQKVLV